MSTSVRKIEHLNLCVEKDVEAHKSNTGLRMTGFDDIELIAVTQNFHLISRVNAQLFTICDR